MIKIIRYPEKAAWKNILQRPQADNDTLLENVAAILNDIKQDGDNAVKKYCKQFDDAELEDLAMDTDDWETSNEIPDALKAAIQQAAANIKTFHKSQAGAVEVIETMPGIKCWRKSVAIDKVGLYIPGGSAPLFSTVLMLGIPAQIAGCKEIILCTPVSKDKKVHPAILYAAQLCGINKIYKVGGVQAIAAMAYGTETIMQVNKIFGPGNRYVTAAKQLVQQQGTAIDMPAGPSEVCILADETAAAAFVAADLISQAEHGADSQVLLISTNEKIIDEVTEELKKQMELLPRKNIAILALQNSKCILVKNIAEAIAIINEYASEHLILCCDNAAAIADEITNAGSVFIGNYSPESVGDYASGTNHVLPTNGFAKAYSGVSVDSFTKKITYQQLDYKGLQNISATVIAMAEAEGLQGHANAVKIRL
jgi:histidinol dehydrogenase